MKRLLPVLMVFGVFLGSAGESFSTDFQKGFTAFEKGDYATALREFEPLAEQGDADAQYRLGWMYEKGEGVPQNDKTALKWYTLSAKQGNVLAQYNLGVMYRDGQGVLQDDKTAVKWFRLAADQGDAPAQYNLGVMYDNGQGVPQDYKTAAKWYKLSAGQGWSANSQKVYKRQFSDVELQLPDHERLCLLRNIENEKYVLDNYKKNAEQNGYNKFVLMWVDCKSHKKIQDGTKDWHNQLSEWVIILSPRQKNGKVKIFRNVSRREFFNNMLDDPPSTNLYNAEKRMNENLRKLNARRIIKLEKQKSLGLLAFGSALHNGGIGPVPSQLGGQVDNLFVIGVWSMNYINNINLNVYHHKKVNKNRWSKGIKDLLSQSINYSDLLLLQNK
jgi:hypothetical protein